MVIRDSEPKKFFKDALSLHMDIFHFIINFTLHSKKVTLGFLKSRQGNIVST